MDVVSYLRLTSGLANAEGRQRALHYRSAWLRAFTTALHETSNGVLARLSGFALGYPLASLGPRKLGGYGGNFLQMKTTQRKGDRKAVEESQSKAER